MQVNYYGASPSKLRRCLFRFFAALGILTSTAVCAIGTGITFHMWATDGYLWWEMPILLFFVFLCNLFSAGAYGELCAEEAQYIFSIEGIQVKFPLQRIQKMPWNDFQQICVCYKNYGRNSKIIPVIAMIKKGEKVSFFCHRWKTDNPLHYRGVMCMNFSHELLNNMQKVCPYRIVDLRETPDYKVWR